jgi:hypothetical protein
VRQLIGLKWVNRLAYWPQASDPVSRRPARSNIMTPWYMVGIKTTSKSTGVTVEAEDALIAALKVKQENPTAMITYVRKHNARGDRRHPHTAAAAQSR